MRGRTMIAIVAIACCLIAFVAIANPPNVSANDGAGPLRNLIDGIGDRRDAVAEVAAAADRAREQQLRRLRSPDFEFQTCSQHRIRIEQSPQLLIEHRASEPRRIIVVEQSREPDTLLLLRNSSQTNLRIVTRSPHSQEIVIRR